MSKNDVLTEEEYSKFKMDQRTLNFMKAYCHQHHLQQNELNVLDWGCGRGRSVLFLREQGYNAFGVDIDPKPIENGKAFFHQKGYDPLIMNLIDQEGTTKYAEGFFHFTFSNNVFEHIRDKELVVKELRRVTKPGGVSFHTFPPHKGIVEGHLFMPFVHWLPKNRSRKYLIFACVALGKEPRWEELNGMTVKEKTEVYYQYSLNKTHYKKYSEIKQIFKKNGFQVNYKILDHPKLMKYKVIHKLTNNRLLRSLIEHLLLTFKLVHMYCDLKLNHST